MAKRKIRKDIIQEIEVPSEITLEVNDNVVTMKKDGKELSRKIDSEIKIEKDNNRIKLSTKNARKNEKRKFGTSAGHINNMIEGLTKGFEYDLEICNVHFPMTVTFDKSKSEFIIKNLLGEKAPRIIKIEGHIETEIKAPNIKIKSYDLEIAGRAASRLERGALIRNRDRNKFQDGIFITKKPGKTYI